jgi:hypothetical protein
MLLKIVKEVLIGIVKLVGFTIASCLELGANILYKISEQIKKHTK